MSGSKYVAGLLEQEDPCHQAQCLLVVVEKQWLCLASQWRYFPNNMCTQSLLSALG
eukprot:m.181792 g.181792  ORF g.181792 m.181792 type:complete len:56 (-) comp15359_c0_seq1:1363-1530(-)